MFTPPYQEVVEEQGWCQSTGESLPPEPPHFAPGNNKTSRKGTLQAELTCEFCMSQLTSHLATTTTTTTSRKKGYCKLSHHVSFVLEVFTHFLKDAMTAVAEDPDYIHCCQDLSNQNDFFILDIENHCHN